MSQYGHFFWNELNTRDVDKAQAFYRDLIGWTYEATPTEEGGDYWLAKMDGHPVAGILPLAGSQLESAGDFWLSYLEVEDVDQRVAEAVAAGATVVRELWDIPQTGRRAVLREPTGALIAWMTRFEND